MRKCIEHLFNSIRQCGIPYILTGLWNTVFGFGLYISLLMICGDKYYLILGILSHIIAVSNAFICYKFFVFKSKGDFWKEYFKCHLVYAGGMLLGTAEMYICVSLFGFDAIYSNIAITLLNIGMNFIGQRYFSFSSKLNRCKTEKLTEGVS
ncbi:MAG: GtrA family protein [Lentisphaeria bacterium]|nr:GtrA family protein [Lentisphaeria bacterium]